MATTFYRFDIPQAIQRISPKATIPRPTSLTTNPAIIKVGPASGCFRYDSLPKPTKEIAVPTMMTIGTAQFVQTRMEQSTATNVVKTKSDHRLY